MDVDGVLEVSAKLFRFLLSEGVTSDDFKRLLDIDGLLRAGLEVGDTTLGLAKGHRALRRDYSLALFNVNLVSEDDLDGS